jgi:hypothetical protein
LLYFASPAGHATFAANAPRAAALLFRVVDRNALILFRSASTGCRLNGRFFAVRLSDVQLLLGVWLFLER